VTRIAADWLTDRATRAVCDAFATAGHTMFFVGGCVRNALLGLDGTDVDVATPASPETVQAAAEAAGLKTVPTGIDHGTVTIVARGQPFEVTTFRRDVETDGRRAVVAYSDRLEDDAARRDFTMNALYARPDGEVIDPVGGLADLRAGRLRFIGDPQARIAEDYLRILRFFRFHAWYAEPAGGLDADGLAACAAGLDGLSGLAAERVGHEMRKLLAAPDPAPSVAAMAQIGALARVLPGATPVALAPLVALEPELDAEPDWIRRLAVLGGEDAKTHLRLSKSEARRLAALLGGIAALDGPAALAYRHGADAARDIVLARAALSGTCLPAEAGRAIARGAAATFPVGAQDLMPAYRGAELGQTLADLEAAWIASDFTLDREALLERLDPDRE
jgi:poly(A) polymerase